MIYLMGELDRWVKLGSAESEVDFLIPSDSGVEERRSGDFTTWVSFHY